jgi:hypothetical protein
MSALIIELQRASLRGNFPTVLREELEKAGMTSGRLAVGDVASAPEMVYFLWHEGGEVPVSMLITRATLDDDFGARKAATVFLSKWKRRMA